MRIGEWQLLSAWPEWLLAALILALLAAWLERRAGGGRGAALQRGIVLGLIGLALARPAFDRWAGPPTLLLVDRSASILSESAAGALELGGPGVRALPRIDFGGRDDSPLAGALDLAARALPAGGRILLLSDGRWTDAAEGLDELEDRSVPAASDAPAASPLEVAARLAASGFQIDGLALAGRGGLDVAVSHLRLPPAFRVGESVTIDLRLRATGPASGNLRLLALGEPEREIARRELQLAPGETGLSLELRVTEPGPLRLEARAEIDGDVEPGNDRLQAAAQVADPMSVLILGDGPGAVGLADALANVGIKATVQTPARLPSLLSQLEPWDALVLADVPAAALGLDQIAAVSAFAADLGRGVLLTGGRQSFLPGGWERTALEEMAPVDLEAPNRASREAVALLLMIDQSASMGSIEGRGAISKLALAREAALLASEVLSPGDRVAVVTYDDDARWLLPPTELGAGRELAEIESALAGLATGGGTRMLAALELGLPELAAMSDMPTRHAVLLTDGRDFNTDAGQHLSVVRAARESGVSLSTIAIGSDADRDLLAQLARAGRGRYHSADDPSDLPRLAVEESEILRARSEQRGSFRAAPPRGQASPLLAGVDVAGLPPLGGYLALGPRPGAEVALELGSGDPLLTSWQFGLGRVVAWTSDLGEAWAGEWPASPAGIALWARALRYAARAPDAGPPGLVLQPRPDGAHLELDLRDRAGRAIDLAQASLVLTQTDSIQRIDLPQQAPGLYAGHVHLDAPGAWTGLVEARTDREGWSLPVAIARPYAPELMPVTLDEGLSNLSALARAGGGRVLPSLAELDLDARPRSRIELWPWLLVLASLLWLAEVARLTDLFRGGSPFRRG